jgi:Sec-independent protein translocase protein TatA
MESVLLIAVVFFSGYGLKAFATSITSYVTELKENLETLNETSSRAVELQERTVTLMEENNQSNRPDNIVEFNSQQMQRTGTTGEPQVEVEFHNEAPVEYNRQD